MSEGVRNISVLSVPSVVKIQFIFQVPDLSSNDIISTSPPIHRRTATWLWDQAGSMAARRFVDFGKLS
jgi:hypothetical protein